MTEGTIKAVVGRIGFIEFGNGLQTTFYVSEQDQFEVGDTVQFELVEHETDESEEEINEAIGVRQVDNASGRKPLHLFELANEIGIESKAIYQFLVGKGYDYRYAPNLLLSESVINLVKDWSVGRKGSSLDALGAEPLKSHPPGTVIETTISHKIEPSQLYLEFIEGYFGCIRLTDLAWNYPRAEAIFRGLSEGDRIQAVVLSQDSENRIVQFGVKHLVAEPSETDQWDSISIGEILQGTIIDWMDRYAIIDCGNGIFGYGLVDENFVETGEFVVIEKSPEANLLELAAPSSVLVESMDRVTILDKSGFFSPDPELRSFETFRRSLLYVMANDEEQIMIEEAFGQDPRLFARDFRSHILMSIHFKFQSTAWEQHLPKFIIPSFGINGGLPEKEQYELVLSQLGQMKYWFRINRRGPKDGIEPRLEYSMFNEQVNIHGHVDVGQRESSVQFQVKSISVGKYLTSASEAKKSASRKGAFLLKVRTVFKGPTDPPGNLEGQKKLLNLLSSKTNAISILSKLQKQAGVIIRSEGKALMIFDRFLEYQESLARGSIKEAFLIKDYKRIPSPNSRLALALPDDIADYFSGDDGDIPVNVRIKIESSKESSIFDYPLIGEGIAMVGSRGWQLTLDSAFDLEAIKSGYYLEKKVSTYQIKVQREIIRDFLEKKIKLDHIETLLMHFDRIQAPEVPMLRYFNPLLGQTETNQPDNNQVRAVKKAVGNQNVFLIQGPPGTGKTTVIAEVVKQLVMKKERVLVCSQTHVAVDNVLAKLVSDENLNLIRIGNLRRIRESLRDYHVEGREAHYLKDFKLFLRIQRGIISRALEMEDLRGDLDELKEIVRSYSLKYSAGIDKYLRTKNFELITEVRAYGSETLSRLIPVLEKWESDLEKGMSVVIRPLLFRSVDVVFATCIGIRTSSDISREEMGFDTVILDEAGKANMAESLVAISMAKKVILVGDQKQLPPYLDGNLLDPASPVSFPNSKYGEKFKQDEIQHALATSFFEFLINRIDDNKFPSENKEILNYQHRMHPSIGEFVSRAFYDGEVRMGEKTWENRLELPSPFEKEVIFVNTGTFPTPYESFDGYSAYNEAECDCIVYSILPKVFEGQLSPKDIAIIAPYNQQVKQLQKRLAESGLKGSESIAVATLDSFQGMEFDLIIFSFTRSASPDQESKKVGFLDDARRLNVAFSRAKKKLILVGNVKTLTQKSSHFDFLYDYTGLFKRLIEHCRNPKCGILIDVARDFEIKTAFSRFAEKYQVGDMVTGLISGIGRNPEYTRPYGVFVTVEGIQGMLHHKMIPKNLFDLWEEHFKVGDELQVRIESINKVESKVNFQLLSPNPSIVDQQEKGDETLWAKVITAHLESQLIEGIVVKISSSWLEVKLFEGPVGLLHKSDLRPANRSKVNFGFQIGSTINVRILSCDMKKSSIKLMETKGRIKE